MSEMIERVAEAIDAWIGDIGTSRMMAREAVEVMRDATPDLTEAALGQGTRFGHAAMQGIWARMIDAALKDTHEIKQGSNN